MFENYPDVVDVLQLSKMLNISRTNTYRLLKQGTIKSIRIGGQHRIPKQYVVELINKGADIHFDENNKPYNRPIELRRNTG